PPPPPSATRARRPPPSTTRRATTTRSVEAIASTTNAIRWHRTGAAAAGWAMPEAPWGAGAPWTSSSRVIKKIAMLGNHVPRQCGIATFTTDLRDAIAAAFPTLDCFALAMNDGDRRHPYPSAVRFEIADRDITSYRRAADFLNVNSVDVTCVQHEYGIFGGKGGSHVLSLLRELRMPIVTTLHTIPEQPDDRQPHEIPHSVSTC